MCIGWWGQLNKRWARFALSPSYVSTWKFSDIEISIYEEKMVFIETERHGNMGEVGIGRMGKGSAVPFNAETTVDMTK